MNTVQVLKKARALIAEHGLAKNTYGDKHDGFCAVGALRAAHPNKEYTDNTLRVLAAPLPAVWRDDKDPWFAIVNWNDQVDRTKAQVLSLFTKAIKRLEVQKTLKTAKKHAKTVGKRK